MIKNIFFDFFGVVSGEITPIWLAKHYKENALSEIRSQISSKVDCGEMSGEEMYNKLSQLTEVSSDVIKKEFAELAIINKELVEFIKSLKERYNVYLLSNACSEFLRGVLEKNNLFSLFKKVFISSEIRLAKPNEKFFQYVLEDLGVNASESIMIDDNVKNINGAKCCSINGIVYENLDQLKEELKNKYNII